MSEFLVYDRGAKNLVPGSPFPSEEAAEAHVARLAADENRIDRPNHNLAVVEVPEEQ
jgi:hypothetical protein